LSAFVDEFGFTQDGDVRLEIADQSPVSDDIGECGPVLGIKQLTKLVFGIKLKHQSNTPN
jgi:hypothetical protein